MSTQEIANRLVEYCRKGEFEKAQKELFAEEAVSIEPQETPDFKKETKGLQNIIEKGHKFESMVEQLHSIAVSDPICAANSFAVILSMNVTMKQRGQNNLSELCVYTVKEGKIISEQFYM